MLGSYPPRADNEGLDAYLDALENALLDHPREVAIGCMDPLHGVVRQCKFVPTVADIHAWCERMSVDMRDVVRRDDARIAADRQAREAKRLMLADRSVRPTVADLKARLGPTFGIDTGFDPVLATRGEDAGRDREAFRARRASREREANQRSMLAEYAAKGFEPVFDGGGRVRSYAIVVSMSPGLLRPAAQAQEFSYGAEDPA